MTIEFARRLSHQKPWGMRDVRRWSKQEPDGVRTGEISYERESGSAENSSLWLKLLFADQPLSIQVHPYSVDE
jgi:mannose-6-phosphate isomerase